MTTRQKPVVHIVKPYPVPAHVTHRRCAHADLLHFRSGGGTVEKVLRCAKFARQGCLTCLEHRKTEELAARVAAGERPEGVEIHNA